MAQDDLTSIELSELTWEEGKRATCLGTVYKAVAAKARTASKWYRDNRKPKQVMAMSVRWGAVVLLSASGLVPLIVEVLPVKGAPPFDPLVTSFMVALAAALFGLDKFFNFSSGWMRYVKTDLAVRNALDEFEFEWQIARSTWTASEPAPEQVADMLKRCQAFASRINALVTEETNVWITEFQASLAQLGESVKAAEARVEADAARRAEAAAQAGALNVSVKHNGNTHVGAFRLRVDNDPDGKVYVGPNLALVGLAPGPHKLQAEMEEGGKLHRGEVSVDVVSGKTSQAEVEVVAAA
ncbi:MAG TPA: SLATT domain-containing protein [Longimicrobium sp.]|nr:SLATT domain-containing protein [Longimicrobium sp.]